MIEFVMPLLAAAAIEPEPTVWTYIRAVLASALMIGGLVFVLSGTIGILRLPDFYTRLHAAGMTDTMGAELILLGLIVQSGLTQTSLKLAIVGFFLLITSPTATHAIANAAHSAGLEPILGRWRAAPLDGGEATLVTEGGEITVKAAD